MARRWLRAAALLAARAAAQPGSVVTSAVLSMSPSAPAPDWCLQLNELLLFNTEGTVVSAFDTPGATVAGTATAAVAPSTLGGVNDWALGSVTAGAGAVFNATIAAHNPYNAQTSGGFTGTCGDPSSTLTFTFAPSVVAQAILFNREDAFTARAVANGYTLTLYTAGGAPTESVAFDSNATVVVRSFASPIVPAAPPAASDPLQVQNSARWIRYVRVTAAAAQYLHFRELMVFDTANTNVAYGKTTSNTACRPGPPTQCADRLVDHIIDFDAVGAVPEVANLFHGNTAVAGAWAEVDLGAAFPVSKIVVFNRWLNVWLGGAGGSATGGVVGARLATANVTGRNAAGRVVFRAVLAGAPIQVVSVQLPASATPSPTTSAGGQPSLTSTATASLTPARTPTATPTNTPSTTPSPSGTASITPTATPSAVNVLPGGSLVAVRLAGSTTAATAVLLDVLATAGGVLTLVGSLPMPMLPPADPAQYRLTVGGADTRWGGLTLSGDGQYLVVAGCDAAPGTSLVNTTRVVGTLRYDGVVDVSTSLGGGAYTNAIWGAASQDATEFWTVGSSATPALRGVWYVTAGSVGGGSMIWNAGSGDGWTSIGVHAGRLSSMYYLASAAIKNLVAADGTLGGSLPQGPALDGTGYPTLPWVSTYRYRGYSIVPQTMFAIAEETQGGVYVYRVNATGSWESDGAIYAIPVAGDRSPIGVHIAAASGLAYVTTLTGKIYALDTAARAWASAAAVYSAPAGSSLRGIAAAPVRASTSPTPSMSATPSGSLTASASTTRAPNVTPSSTTTATASLTASTTGTPSNSPTPSITPSSTSTATVSPTASPTPAWPLASQAVLGMAGGASADWCLAVVEVMLFNLNGQVVNAAGSPGASATASGALLAPGTVAGATDLAFGSLTNSTPAATGTVFAYNPYTGFAGYAAVCEPGANLTFRFPPQAIAQVVVVTRQDNNATLWRPVGNGYTVQLLSASGALLESRALDSNATVVTRAFSAPFNPPTLPSPSDPAQLGNAGSWVRYIRLTTTVAQHLHVREVQVFDTSNTNVALGKATSSNNCRANQCGDKTVDGVIDFDAVGANETLNVFHTSTAVVGAWVELDLGGVFNVARVVVYNRWLNQWLGGYGGSATGGVVGARLAGVSVTARSGVNGTLFTGALTAVPIQALAITLPSPSGTPSSSASAAATGTPSPTGSLSAGAPPSVTPAGTPSSSGTPTVTASPTPSRSPTASGTPTGTLTASGTPTSTLTPSGTPTRSAAPTATPPSTSSATPSATAAATGSGTPSGTASGTSSGTGSGSASGTGSQTGTGTGSSSGTGTGSGSSSITVSGSPSCTGTRTADATASGTPAATQSGTPAATQSGSPAATLSGTPSRSKSALPTRSRTATRTRTRTATKTKTKTKTKTRTRTPSKKVKLME